jgi:hypothetical protein
MARKPKTSKPRLDRAQEKARKQKRLAAALGVFLVLVLVYEVPHTMKLMNKTAKAPVVTSSATAPAAATPAPTTASTPARTSTTVAPVAPAVVSPTSTATGGLVSSVQVTPDPGQLTEFQRFASKDPFTQSVQKTGATTTPATGNGGTAAKTPKKTTPTVPKAPPAPPATTAVISLNGELMSVTVGSQFPTAGVTFGRVGSLFQLDGLTLKTAKVSIVGGSYADGAPALTLAVGKPITLQNTADGTRYTLILEPPGTPIPTSTTPTSTTPAVTSTTPSVVPSSSGG